MANKWMMMMMMMMQGALEPLHQLNFLFYVRVHVIVCCPAAALSKKQQHKASKSLSPSQTTRGLLCKTHIFPCCNNQMQFYVCIFLTLEWIAFLSKRKQSVFVFGYVSTIGTVTTLQSAVV